MDANTCGDNEDAKKEETEDNFSNKTDDRDDGGRANKANTRLHELM